MSRLLTPEDLYALRLVEDPQISPDGSRVAYVLMAVDREAQEYRRTIWVAPTTGGEPRRYSAGPKDTSPRWSPDGRMLAFVRAPASGTAPKTADDREKGVGKPQIWLLAADGGEARQLTTLRHGAGSPAWSPDGLALAFTAPTGDQDDAEVDDAALQGKHLPRVRTIDRLWYRLEDVGYLYDRRTHVFTVRADGSGVKQLTCGDFDAGEPSWSPDGATLAFTADRSADRWRWPAASVWRMAADGGEPTRLTDEALGCAAPTWSPDGATLAFLANPRRHGVGHTDLYVVPADQPGAQRLLTQDFVPTCADTTLDDMRVAHLHAHLTWSPDGQAIYFLASMRGTTHVYAARPQGNRLPRRVTDGGCRVYGFSLDVAATTLALGVSTPTVPGDLYTQPLAGESAMRSLVEVNAAALAEVELARPEEFAFRGADGWELQGWVVRPPRVGNGEEATVPAVLEIHGGPAAMYGESFMLEFQLLAAHGFAVVYSNPRGSTGYGRIFSGAVINDWGGKDYQDVLAGLDAAIARGGIDANRLGVAGGSYGGFMTNWIVGHSDRFKAAVTMRSVTNMATMFGTSDLGWGLVLDELNATPWEDRERLAGFSPITFVERIHTPLLILHGESDLRCPISEAEQLFAALCYLGRETQLVRFEEQNHDLSRGGHPRSRVIRLRKILDWFERRT
ncbi:MAG: S9 family peptidase [Ktedonobacterales bacterium]|nr:S9 family peptidase [Ktedonobacterales bacterium]